MTLPTVHNTTNPRSRGFDAQLDNLLLRLAVAADRQVRITSAESNAQRIQTSESPEEFTADFGDVYARSDFTGGAGLDRAHRRGLGDTAAARYWDSRNVKVVDGEPGDPPELCLLEDTEEALAAAGDPIRVLYHGGILYATDGSDVHRTANPTAASPTWATDDPTSGVSAALSLASLGDTVYAAFGVSGLYKRQSGVWSNVYTDDADGVWSVKNRLLVSDGVDLWDETGGARPAGGNELKILPAGQSWVAAVDGGSHILAAATDGYVYAWTVNDSGNLVLDEQTRFEAETPTALGAAQGVVFVATTSAAGVGRLWRCEVADSGALVGEVVREWASGAPRAIVADRENVYTVVSEDADESHAWRYSLVHGGIHRWWIFDGLGGAADADGLALVDGRLFAGLSGEGVHRTLTTYPAEGGWLITPLGDFHTSDAKAWVEARVDVGPVVGGATVSVYWTGDPDAILDAASGSWVRVVDTASSPGGVLTKTIVNRFARYAAGKVELTPTSDLAGCPSVRSVGFRAYPEQPDVVIDLPVNVSDVVEPPGRRSVRVRGRGSEVYAELQAREGRPCLLRLYRPAETVRGVVQRVATPQSALTRRGGQTLFSLVTVRGQRTTVTETTLTAGTTGSCLTGMCLTGAS